MKLISTLFLSLCLTLAAQVAAQTFPTEKIDASSKCFTKKGLTWKFYSHSCENGLDNVGCGGCDPYSGDTPCDKYLPILCIYKAKMPRPSYKITCSAAAMPAEFYCGWTGGFINVTKPYRGCEIESKEHADKICAAQFGDCWEMASHGDGYYIQGMNEQDYTYCKWDWSIAGSGGWAFYAYGNVSALKYERFWTYIDNQPGNCWN